MAGSIAKAYVQVIPSAEGIKNKLSGVFGSEMPSAGQSAGGIFGSSMVGKIKGLVAAAGIGKMLAESLQTGAALQQSLGGVETLFKDSAGIVIANAEKAYKTAGLSANQYMETVTSFSASLLQSLGGDTEAAAAAADIALIDMADNANKMGTSMEAIQNAYQGFAKQNYTMLDNLKLGYGGTKTEMQRLLADAQRLTGIEYDIDKLSDVYAAIHAIQDEMEITGTTAEEASSTFSGSLASMKATFSDLLANLSTGRDIGPSLIALGETVFTFARDNLLPMVGNILMALPEVLSSTFSMAIQGLNLISNNTDTIVQMGADLVISLGSAIITALPYLAESAVKLVASLGKSIINTDWETIGQNTVSNLRESLDIAAGEILGTDGNIVQSVIDAINSGLPDLLENGGLMVNHIVDGIFSALPGLTDSALDLSVSFVETLLSNLPHMLSAGKDILLNVVDGIRKSFPDILVSAGDAVVQLLSGFVKNCPNILAAGFDLMVSLIEGIGNAYPDIIAAAGEVAKNLWNAIKEIDWLQLGKDIILGLINGMGAMYKALWNAAVKVAESALDAIKDFFGIASPSKVMRDQVGKWIPTGVAVGIEGNTKPLTDAMHSLSDMTVDTLQSDFALNESFTRTLTASAPPNAIMRTSADTTSEMLMEMLLESNLAGHETTVELLRQILEAVLGISIGDDVIATAVERHHSKMAIVKGV